MQEDTIIQKNLFSVNDDTHVEIETKEIPGNLSAEDLKKESQKRPRQRKNSTNLINKFKSDLISNNKNVCINE